MALWMTGIDHKRADLNVRSVFSFTKRKMEEAYAYFKKNPDVQGCVLLSTCNRTELWISAADDKVLSPAVLLCRFLKVDIETYRSYFIEYRQKEATEHLFRVASGLESRIIGEDQIITQVKDALVVARSCYASDHTLEVLFRLAVTAGKRVRTETELSSADRSVINTAIRTLSEKNIDVKDKKCLVIGNGMMGKISAQALIEQGADVTMTIRQYHSGIVDTPPGCKRVDYQKKLDILPSCDFVVSATSSPNYTLRFQELAELSVNHPVCMIDLAVPRDIEQKISELTWARLYDIDSFHIDMHSEQFQENLRKAEQILQEEEEKFYEWYEGKNFVPRIQTLKEIAGSDVLCRLTPVMKKITIEEESKQKLGQEVADASARMMNRLLFGLRTKLSDETFQECLSAMEEVLQSS